MAGNMIKSDDKPYHLYLSIEQFNQLMETIELMISIDDKSEVTKEMIEMRDTIMRFTRKQKNKNGDDCAAVILYEKEACPLIKVLLFYIATFRTIEPKDYYSDIRKNVRSKKDEREKES